MPNIYLIKILILTGLSFTTAFLLTPMLTHYLYKYRRHACFFRAARAQSRHSDHGRHFNLVHHLDFGLILFLC